MSFKMFLQLAVAAMFFIFSSIATWYEGSKILDAPWEWKYTAIFSNMAYGQVKSANVILPIDHFVYAAKFEPTFPLVMLISGVYFISVLLYVLLKHSSKAFSYYLSCVGLLFVIGSDVVSDSSTIGLNLFFTVFLGIGVLFLVMALVRIFKESSKKIGYIHHI